MKPADENRETGHLQEMPSVGTGKVEVIHLTDDGVFPNNDKLPLLLYHNGLPPAARDDPAVVRTLFAGRGWTESWVNGIYDFHHYHSTAHEVLAICAGQAEVQFGGPEGVRTSVSAGDVVVIPAGVAHRNLGSSDDFTVVGAYPQGQSYDMCYGKEGERPAADENIARVPLPTSDPLTGPAGPLNQHWHI
jgi:uncharacterized protein YjlB